MFCEPPFGKPAACHPVNGLAGPPRLLPRQDWSKYNGFDHVVVRTDDLSAEEVGQAVARARRSVYFSPLFIRNRLAYIRNPRDLSTLARKVLRLMSRSSFHRVA